MIKLVSRRGILKSGISAAALAAAAPFTPFVQAQSGGFAEHGWPANYDRISEKSISWLKSKGWWPLKVAWNPLWSDGNATLFAMRQHDLLVKRGLSAEFVPLLTAGLMNEAFIPGNVQVAQAGSLGLLRLVDLKVPTIAVAAYPAQRQAFLVPLDSPLKNGMEDLKGRKVLKRPAVIGVTVGSTNHLGLLIAAKTLNLKEGADFIIKNMGPADIIAMPAGIDVVGIWEPNVLFMTEVRKNVRILELIDRYEVFNGYSYMRGELEQNAPDVVQAYLDAFIEAKLIIRANPDQLISDLTKDVSQRGRDENLIRRDVLIHVVDPKPTLNYVFENSRGFYIDLEIFQAGVMHDAGVLKRRYTADEFRAVLRPNYLANTFKKLNWKIPDQPVFLPSNWGGRIGNPPYPEYGLMRMGRQEFPTKNDLTGPWYYKGKRY
jgi:sulfonate transport system substrate-binding protein